jgi:hypothetical protein
MRVFTLLLIPFFTSAQRVEFFGGAGLNPWHIESIGADSGWVQVTVGPMAAEGEVLKVHIPQWESIDTVNMVAFAGKQSIVATLWVKKANGPENDWFGYRCFPATNPGETIFFRYTVKRKRA